MVDDDCLRWEYDVSFGPTFANDRFLEVLEHRHSEDTSIQGEFLVVNIGVELKLGKMLNIERYCFAQVSAIVVLGKQSLRLRFKLILAEVGWLEGH